MIVTGLVDEPVKWGLLRGAVALVSPSANESFSLVVLEAWVAGVPVVVNGRCAVTREHCERSGGGLWFDGYAQFEAVIDRLVADDELRAALADAARPTSNAPTAGPRSRAATRRSWVPEPGSRARRLGSLDMSTARARAVRLGRR